MASSEPKNTVTGFILSSSLGCSLFAVITYVKSQHSALSIDVSIPSFQCADPLWTFGVDLWGQFRSPLLCSQLFVENIHKKCCIIPSCFYLKGNNRLQEYSSALSLWWITQPLCKCWALKWPLLTDERAHNCILKGWDWSSATNGGNT